jgi:hypothetical protein
LESRRSRSLDRSIHAGFRPPASSSSGGITRNASAVPADRRNVIGEQPGSKERIDAAAGLAMGVHAANRGCAVDAINPDDDRIVGVSE